ncbi:ABC transporter ATP-binding protein [Marinomonas ostreistagni]|uniref:ABC transporter ATP-binding protein n=1 Tax=Marinomonas ostreistagni TaxID=359209 RepID=UPI001EF292AE|nr:ABC transporter ATP-binding protein [Marinomonas ostreistagni]
MIRSERVILDIPELEIPTQGLTVVLGHNGSGKSTMVSLLAGQQPPDQGRVSLNNQDVSHMKAKTLARNIAFLPQKLPSSAGLNVREVVRLGRFPWRGLLGRWTKEDEQIIDQAIARTGINEFASAEADTLSGGERQRAWVAMLLAQQSPILILDEPTSALDIQHQYQLMALLSELCQDDSRGIIVILHDLNLALQYADHIVALNHGQVAFAGQADLLLDEQRLSELYQTPVRLVEHPMSPQYSKPKVAVVCP